MLTPSLSFAGQEAAAESRLKHAAAEFGYRVVLSIVGEYASDSTRLVEDEHAVPQQPARNDVFG